MQAFFPVYTLLISILSHGGVLLPVAKFPGVRDTHNMMLVYLE